MSAGQQARQPTNKLASQTQKRPSSQPASKPASQHDENFIYRRIESEMVGLIPSSGNGKSQDANSLAPDAASELNKFLQTGISTMTTKTAGAFEQGDSPTISLRVSGNGHPSVIVPMLRGTYGNDAVAVSFRFLFSSGRPIEPYSSLPLSLTLPLSFKRWLWPKLLPCMVMPLGLPAGVHLWKAAENTFDKARLGDHKNDSDDEEPGADESMKPNKSGYVVTLVDGSSTRLRFQYDGKQWVPELRTANRDIPIETGMDLQSMAKRVLAHFSKPHEEVPWKDEARLTFIGFQILFDAQCAVARDQGDETLAARCQPLASRHVGCRNSCVGDCSGGGRRQGRPWHRLFRDSPRSAFL